LTILLRNIFVVYVQRCLELSQKEDPAAKKDEKEEFRFSVLKPRNGVDPLTFRLRSECSTTKLTRQDRFHGCVALVGFASSHRVNSQLHPLSHSLCEWIERTHGPDHSQITHLLESFWLSPLL
jgi:hypothetical protein